MLTLEEITCSYGFEATFEEKLVAGVCHVCKKGSEHSITNIAEEDLK